MNFINVEIVLNSKSTISDRDVIGMCKGYLNEHAIKPGTVVSKFNRREHIILYEDVEHIIVDPVEDLLMFSGSYSDENVRWHVYSLDREGPQLETADDDCTEINLATHYVLPSLEIFNMWENLVYDGNIKEKLLNYAQTMVQFTESGVNTNVISCNKVILLHGPPGTGKTSLCKALAQKLSIKLKPRYKQSILVEINSHSLFSKWFSESGKLVTKMFNKIRNIVEVPGTLVCVLIDEIESLTHARDQCLSGNEPSDSIKVVNAVLTQIDQIKRYPNVIILTTSNMTCAIDIAFVDRADVKQYIGLPGIDATYQIYVSCIQELLKTGIIKTNDKSVISSCLEKELNELCQESIGMSGRMLRKIPFLAHALFLEQAVVYLEDFLEAMHKAIKYEKDQKAHFSNKVS